METFMTQRLEINPPPGWQVKEWSELNAHITFIDNLGRIVRLDAESLVKYTCEKCGEEMFARSNHGRIKCPCGYHMNPVWGEAQLCFLPKNEPEEIEETTDPQVLV